MHRRVEQSSARPSPKPSSDASGPSVFVVAEEEPRRILLMSQLAAMNLSADVYDSIETYCNKFDGARYGCLILDSHSATVGAALRRRLANAPLVPPIIYLADDIDAAVVVQVMKAGAVDFLHRRSYSEADLWDAIQRGLGRDAEAREAHQLEAERRSLMASLSEIERQVLRLLMRGSSNAAIAAKLGISQAAVEGRRTRLMKKLGLKNLPALVRFVLEGGFESEI